MHRFLSLMFAVFMFFGITSCKGQSQKGSMVEIKTEFGNMKLKLYDKTPEHKKNFLKLVNDGYYNDLLFHRVIKSFMVQGGDPDSKNAEPGTRLGGGSPGYTLSACLLRNLVTLP